MSRKKILILDGHPAPASLSAGLAGAYLKGASQTQADIRLVRLSELQFDMDFGSGGYTHHKPLEPELQQFLESLEWCDHFVIAAPMWWGGLPAKLKGLFDRTLLPGRTFDTDVKPGKMPKPMLGGRTGRVLLTSDTPGWVLRFIYGNAIIRQIRSQILGFIGIKPARFTRFSGATHASPDTVQKWLTQARDLGLRQA